MLLLSYLQNLSTENVIQNRKLLITIAQNNGLITETFRNFDVAIRIHIFHR